MMANDERVIVWAAPRDAHLTCEFLATAGIACVPHESWRTVERALSGPIGTLIIAGELLTADVIAHIETLLQQQPAWSDLPIVVVAGAGASASDGHAVERLGNVAILPRPLSLDVLRATVAASLRGRRRQYQVRDLLRQREEADRRKDEFLGMLAHELRNPLAPLRTGLHLLRLDPAPDVVTRTYAMMDRQIAHVTQLIDDLLDVSRLTRGKITLQKQRLDLIECARHVVEAMRPAAAQKSLRLRARLADEPLWVDGDPVRIAQVVGNLLSNAIKYTPEDGRIEITASRVGDEVVLRVTDNGMGIPPDQLPYVFDLFAQTPRPLDRSQGGLGIGLTIVRMIASLHGGDVHLFSAGENCGTEAVMRLPAAVRSAPLSPPAAAGAAPTLHAGRPQRVLIIEDNQDSAEMLATYLRFAGHDVTVAEDGAKGVELALELRPTVVLCDIGLPGMNGYDVAKRLTGLAELAGTTFVAVTGYGEAAARQQSRDAGFAHHLTKPVDPATVAELIGQGGLEAA